MENCYFSKQEKHHTTEIQRLKKEADELKHRVSYLHKTLQEREAKLEQQERELVNMLLLLLFFYLISFACNRKS